MKRILLAEKYCSEERERGRGKGRRKEERGREGRGGEELEITTAQVTTAVKLISTIRGSMSQTTIGDPKQSHK